MICYIHDLKILSNLFILYFKNLLSIIMGKWEIFMITNPFIIFNTFVFIFKTYSYITLLFLSSEDTYFIL